MNIAMTHQNRWGFIYSRSCIRPDFYRGKQKDPAISSQFHCLSHTYPSNICLASVIHAIYLRIISLPHEISKSFTRWGAHRQRGVTLKWHDIFYMHFMEFVGRKIKNSRHILRIFLNFWMPMKVTDSTGMLIWICLHCVHDAHKDCH